MSKPLTTIMKITKTSKTVNITNLPFLLHLISPIPFCYFKVFNTPPPNLQSRFNSPDCMSFVDYLLSY